MSIEQMRGQVIGVYGDKTLWKNKVNKMPDNQIIALWYRFKACGLIK